MPKNSPETPVRDRTRKPTPAVCVTPDVVIYVIKLVYERRRDHDFPEWDGFLRDANRNPSLWLQYFDDDPTATYEEFGADAAIVKAVMDVARIIFNPPPISVWTRIEGYKKGRRK